MTPRGVLALHVLFVVSAWSEVATAEPVSKPIASASGHPRLYLTPATLPELRARRFEGVSVKIWKNLAESADWCLTQTPRKEYIAPQPDDPRYENLYDRFYAMMKDMAITEHLAFAYALSGEDKYGDAAREWTLASCRSWKNDAEAEPDGGKAYAVMRLLKGVAVSYDLAFDRFTEEERKEVRGMLVSTSRNYFQKYFTTPSIAGPGFHTHHAVVEFGSFGVVALALLGEATEAADWLDFTVVKFIDRLLPTGLAEDGAQVEGATFWASTMHYRLFFMDALRWVTGRDLFKEFESEMNADLALASIADRKEPGWNEAHRTVVLSPSYGQLDYYSPVLLALAREYRRPIYQYLALWDESLGCIQKTRYITPNRREQLLFELGGYAYLWYDESVSPVVGNEPLSYAFPSVGEVYARGSWEPGGLLVAVKNGGHIVVHAGGEAVLVAPSFGPVDSATVEIVKDSEGVCHLRYVGSATQIVSVKLERPDRATLEWEGMTEDLSFWCHRSPDRSENTLRWESGAETRILKGSLKEVQPEGYAPSHAVGNGLLDLIDPASRKYPLIAIRPSEGGTIRIAVRE